VGTAISSERMFIDHSDTHGIALGQPLSIPYVSDTKPAHPYYGGMAKATRPEWGDRFKSMLRAKNSSLAKLAEKMRRAEPTLRSWTNGTRQINLSEFFEMCAAADIKPAALLFPKQAAGREFAWRPDTIEIAEAFEQIEEPEDRRLAYDAITRYIVPKRVPANRVEDYGSADKRPKAAPAQPEAAQRKKEKRT